MRIGEIHLNASRIAEAENCFRAALQMQPQNARALRDLGAVLIMTHRLAEAEAVLKHANALEPAADGSLNLGQLLRAMGRPQEGLTVLREARQRHPDDARVAAELARILDHVGLSDESEAEFETALARWPGDRTLVYYFGSLLFTIGKLQRAEALYRDYLAAAPQDDIIRSAHLFLMHFIPGMTAERLLHAHQEWDLHHGAALRNHTPAFSNNRDPHRRLRIGYLSPDFKNHGVGRFMAPIFAAHRRDNVEVFAYHDAVDSDAVTDRLRRSASHWRLVYGHNHQQLTEVIRADQIDILVDLTMHMPANRMLLFAHRAAPVQVTYLAYCSTTGLASMDYRLSDPVLDPPGAERDARYVERTARLPQSWWLYEPSAQAPAVQPRPPGGPVVFGCLNNVAKFSPGALALWADILKAVSGSQLFLHCAEGRTRERLLAELASLGVAADRVRFAPLVSLEQFHALHHQIDIALDPFPYGGGTTTCDALWMDVPVITLLGDLAVGRGTASILTNIGLPDLIAKTQDAYADLAVRLANDGPRRAELRQSLRQRMTASPLMDARGFIEGLENAYRTMWQSWCASTQGAS